MPRTTTIRDVAREAGFSPATVSLALRNHPRLLKATCLKVQRIAKKMGYRPNALVAQLLAQLRASRTPKFQSTIGLINASENQRILSEISTFREWVEGCRERAIQLGYGIDEFWLHEAGMTPHRLAGIFQARNIRGWIVVACLGDSALPPGFDEIGDGFAGVAIGMRRVKPPMHIACNDQFATVRQAFDEALRCGYERPALVISEDVDALVEGRFSGGFHAAQRSLPTRRRMPEFLFHSPLDVPMNVKIGSPQVMLRFREWFTRHKPDAILCIHHEVKAWVEQAGAHVPRDVGLIHLDWNDGLKNWAGMNQNSRLIGAAGVDMLIGQLHRNEVGIPPFPKCMMIESSWVAGGTVRRKPG